MQIPGEGVCGCNHLALRFEIIWISCPLKKRRGDGGELNDFHLHTAPDDAGGDGVDAKR